MKKMLPFVFLLLLTAPLRATQPSLLDIDEERLLQGNLQILNDTTDRQVGVLLIKAPPQKVWEIISDWEQTSRLVSGISYNRVMQRSTARTIIEGRFNLELFKSQYTVEVQTDEKNLHQKWQLLPDSEIRMLQQQGLEIRFSGGGIREMHGYHYLLPHPQGTVYYCAPVVTSAIPLPEFAARKIRLTIFNNHMYAVKKKAEARPATVQAEPLPPEPAVVEKPPLKTEESPQK